MKNNEILTPGELAKYLKLSKRTVMNLLNSGTLNARKVGGSWRILKSELDKYLRNEKK
jgi:excisionase family DNA binding protein